MLLPCGNLKRKGKLPWLFFSPSSLAWTNIPKKTRICGSSWPYSPFQIDQRAFCVPRIIMNLSCPYYKSDLFGSLSTCTSHSINIRNNNSNFFWDKYDGFILPQLDLMICCCNWLFWSKIQRDRLLKIFCKKKWVFC